MEEFDIWLYLACFAMSLLGQGTHLMFVKIPSMRRLARASNKRLILLEWWECDWNLIIGMQLIIMALFIGLDQVFRFKPEAMQYSKWMFFFVGFGGSSAIMSWLSKYAPGVIGLISVKSNIADAQMGTIVTSVDEAIEKGKEITGVDVEKSPTLLK